MGMFLIVWSDFYTKAPAVYLLNKTSPEGGCFLLYEVTFILRDLPFSIYNEKHPPKGDVFYSIEVYHISPSARCD